MHEGDVDCRSNNTNKHSPQEPCNLSGVWRVSSNNTNKHSPQELDKAPSGATEVQIIQINIVLKNTSFVCHNVIPFK